MLNLINLVIMIAISSVLSVLRFAQRTATDLEIGNKE